MGFSAPTYWDRETRTGSYTNAKLWPENYREPWEVITSLDYQPVWGDIIVFDGNYGHIVVVEKVEGDKVFISEYNRLIKENFDNDYWTIGDRLSGCGPFKAYLHNPNRPEETTKENGADLIKQFELFVNNMKGQITSLTESNTQLRNRLEEINNLSQLEVK